MQSFRNVTKLIIENENTFLLMFRALISLELKKNYICGVFNSDSLKCQIFGLKDGIILLFSLLRIYKLKRNVVELATASSITSLFRYDPL